MICLVVAVSAGCRREAVEVRRALAFSDQQPRYLRPVPYTPAPAGVGSLSAEACGRCHRAIYEEWRVSTHARAWLDDAQFQEELAKSRQQGVDWMCVNCHTPLMNQIPRWVVGLIDDDVSRPTYVDNPYFDEALQQEAITCATCHVRDGVVLGPFGGTRAPHPVKKDASLLTTAVCTQCHQARAFFEPQQLLCAFNTGEEHAQSPYGQQGQTCQQCHMPEVERPLWVGGREKKKTRRHWFGGSLIPKHPKFATELIPLRPHYPPGLDVRWVDLPSQLRAGEQSELTLEIENARAGHYLPTGDPERFVSIDVEVSADDGTVLARETDRIGIIYQWHPKVKKLSDNRLAPKEKRRYRLRFIAPSGEGSGQVQLRARAGRHRISQENFDYHKLSGRYVAGETFFQEVTTLAIAP